MSYRHKASCGQTAIEYLLLLAVVAVVVIASFSPGSLISQVQDKAQNFYNAITQIIEGRATPTPVDGKWCMVACTQALSHQNIYSRCACPAPAYGGHYCQGVGEKNQVIALTPGNKAAAWLINCDNAPSPQGTTPALCVPDPVCLVGGNAVCGFDDNCPDYVCGSHGGNCPAGQICVKPSGHRRGACKPQPVNCQGGCSLCSNSQCEIYTITRAASFNGIPCTFNGKEITCLDPTVASCKLYNVGACGTRCTVTARNQSGQICSSSSECCGPDSCKVTYTDLKPSLNGGAPCQDVGGEIISSVPATGLTVFCPSTTTCKIGGELKGKCDGLGKCVCEGDSKACYLSASDGKCVACKDGGTCIGGTNPTCQCPINDNFCILDKETGHCNPCPSGQHCDNHCCSQTCDASLSSTIPCGQTNIDNCGYRCLGQQCPLTKWPQVCEPNLLGDGLLKCCKSCRAMGIYGDLGSPCGDSVVDGCGWFCECGPPYVCNSTSGKCEKQCSAGQPPDACGTCGGGVSTNACLSGRSPSCSDLMISGTLACGGPCAKTYTGICPCMDDGGCLGTVTYKNGRPLDFGLCRTCGRGTVCVAGECRLRDKYVVERCPGGLKKDACGICGGKHTLDICVAADPICANPATSLGWSTCGWTCAKTFTGTCPCADSGGCLGKKTFVDGSPGPCVTCGPRQVCAAGVCQERS